MRLSDYISTKCTDKVSALDAGVDGRFHYVYRITNIKESKHYYGSRSSTIPPKKDLGIKYFSSISSKDFKWIVSDQRTNPEAYKYKVLKVFDNNKDKIVYESFLHYKFDVKSHNSFYNKSNQTPTGFNTNGMCGSLHPLYGTSRSDSTKSKISKSLVGRYSGKDSPNYGKARDYLSAKFTGTGNPFHGKVHSEATKAEFSASRTGRLNSNSKCINIYDTSGVLQDTCIGTFKAVCKSKEYPLGAFQKALKLELLVYEGTLDNSIKNKSNLIFKGWKVVFG